MCLMQTHTGRVQLKKLYQRPNLQLNSESLGLFSSTGEDKNETLPGSLTSEIETVCNYKYFSGTL